MRRSLCAFADLGRLRTLGVCGPWAFADLGRLRTLGVCGASAGSAREPCARPMRARKRAARSGRPRAFCPQRSALSVLPSAFCLPPPAFCLRTFCLEPYLQPSTSSLLPLQPPYSPAHAARSDPASISGSPGTGPHTYAVNREGASSRLPREMMMPIGSSSDSTCSMKSTMAMPLAGPEDNEMGAMSAARSYRRRCRMGARFRIR